ncbi:MAG TPA: xanthine dehydrogenase family protein molybdopterin-binding subunit [Gemmatimonadaceae bacterium]|nr:xanthine dehydrogenase family protein molybdopterin-binding subunit [Gemmatimonadaceae bacterium]
MANKANGRRFVSTRVEVEGREEVRTVELPAFELEPWEAGAALGIVGRCALRADGVDKVTGRARYSADIQRAGMLHAAVLRSAVASGRATVNLSRVRSLPGVRDAVTGSDIPTVEVNGLPLLDDAVRYAGQPIAVVCADTRGAAELALREIDVHYDSAPHAVTAAESLAPGAPRVRPNGNAPEVSPRVIERGDVDAGLAEADVVITREYRVPAALHTALEPHGAVAEWTGDRLTVWESTQGVFNTRADLAAALEIPISHVRVIQDYMGGGFGAKNGASTNAYIAALMARRTGRPVRCVNDREGEQTDSGHRPTSVQRVTLGARRDGTLTAIILDAEVALGIGGWEGGPGAIYQELYRCDNVRTTETFAYTNLGAMASFRAPCNVEGAFGLERAMDVLARELGMDPLDLRLVNYATVNQGRNTPYSAKRLDECYRVGAERFGWWVREGATGSSNADGRGRAALDGAPPVPRARDGRFRCGYGMASQIWGGGGGPPAYAMVRLEPDGSAEVLTGTQDLGTGSRTVFAQIAAEALGARLEDVRVVIGDTERTPYTGNSWGSITVASVGPAVRMAAEDARSQLLEAAAGILDTTPDRLVASDGVVRVRRGTRSLTFAEMGEQLGDVMIIGHGSRGPNPDDTTLSTFGAQFAEVEVDVETGVVRVLKIVAVHDSGRIINPALAESQLHGGIIQGTGYALFEERVVDHALGIPLNPNMHDYKIPTMSDIPEIDASFIDVADTVANHIGSRGVAEPPIIPTAPAIANAVSDALGVEVDEIPMTPWRVMSYKERESREQTAESGELPRG